VPALFDGPNAALAVSVALLLNLAFASVPAVRAARLDPIVALRTE
jgi:ABC-type antimicrobial peptide transport system permease subunit